MFIRCLFFALSDVLLPVLSSGLADPGILFFSGLTLRVPVIVPSCALRAPLPDPPGIAWRPFLPVI
jgi:hypothetical protein